MDVFLRFVNLCDRTFSKGLMQNNGAILNVGCDKLLLLAAIFAAAEAAGLTPYCAVTEGFSTA